MIPKDSEVPNNLKKILTTHHYEKDYDDAVDLIYSVLREPESNTKIILVEPNMIYGKDFIESMIEDSDKNPEKIIYADKSKNKKYGILLKPKFFDEKITDYVKGKGYCAWLKQCSLCDGDNCIDYSPTYRKM
jgi:hypothetical protein